VIEHGKQATMATDAGRRQSKECGKTMIAAPTLSTKDEEKDFRDEPSVSALSISRIDL
jgi:hypothetical protein